VLCAGYGTRLGDLTRDLPKPMLPLPEQPLLAFLLGHLRAQGFRDIALNLHFRPEMIRDWFGDGSRWGLRLTYSLEDQLLGTAGGLKRLEAYFRPEETFLVQYGDVLTDQDLGDFVRHHRERRALATLLVHPRPRSNSVVSLDAEGRVVGFLERPSDAARQGVASPWVNSGLCICSPEILDHIPPGTPADLPRDIFARLVPTGRLYALPLSGYRCAIDSPERLAEAREAVVTGRCKIRPLTR
jgi:NDP-sugar pyrophosphorylase family protein